MRTRRLVIALVVLTIAVVILVGSGSSVLYLRDSLDLSRVLYKDFGQDVLLAHAVADGTNPYAPIRELAAQYLAPLGYLNKPYPSPHPPSVGVLFLPLLLVDYPNAVRIWFGIQLICLVAGVDLVIRAAKLPVRHAWTPVIAFALLSWPPLFVDLVLGQLTTIVLALLAATQLALCQGRARTAGCIFGFTLLLKPLAWPWVLLLIWRREWSALATLLAVVLVGFIVPALRVGFGPVLSYPTQVLPYVSAFFAAEPTNISLWTLGPRLFQTTIPLAARLMGIGLPTLVLALTFVWLRRRRPLLGTALGVMICVSILVNPISWQYYLVLVLIPAAYVVESLRAHRYPRVPTILAGMTGIALFLTGSDWADLARLLSSPWIAVNQPLPTFAALLTLGPGLSAGALGLLLAWLSPTAVDYKPESQLVSDEKCSRRWCSIDIRAASRATRSRSQDACGTPPTVRD